MGEWAERSGRPHDFEARLRFLSPEEGGRTTGPPTPGYRSDLRYPEFPEDRSVWMVWLLGFFTDDGDVPEGVRASYDVYARFWILDQDLRETVHRPRVALGTRLEVLEGNRVTARGVVTKLVSLALS